MLSSSEIMRILSIVFNRVRDYPHPYYTLKNARSIAMDALEFYGYAPVLNNDGTITVNGETFKIYRNRTWIHYDIRHIGTAPNH